MYPQRFKGAVQVLASKLAAWCYNRVELHDSGGDDGKKVERFEGTKN
jgi:hypothetical protein